MPAREPVSQLRNRSVGCDCLDRGTQRQSSEVPYSSEIVLRDVISKLVRELGMEIPLRD